MSKTPSSSIQKQLGSPDQTKVMEQANQLLKDKKYKQALSICERYLSTAPNNPQVLNLAGTIAYNNEQLPEAERYFRRAVSLDPKQPWLYFNLANTLSKLGEIQEAEANYKAALSLSHDNHEILAGLGALYVNSGNEIGATQAYEHLINIIPNHPAGLNQLELLYKKYLEKNPEHVITHKKLASIFLQKNNLNEAKHHFVFANSLEPDNVHTLSRLAYVNYVLGNPAYAESIYHEAIKLDPNLSGAHYGVGICKMAQGKRTEAIDCFRTAIRKDPKNTEAHLQLASIIKHTKYSDDIRCMEELIDSPGLDIGRKYSLHFALGKVYEDLQEYGKSFYHFAAGNNLKRSTLNYKTANTRRFVDNIISAFNAELFEKYVHCGHPDSSPIFIVGMPRSGSTLIEQILSSHPDVYGGGEINNLEIVINNYFNQQLKTKFPKDITRTDCQSLAQMGKQYCDSTLTFDKGAKRITNKMPYNFLYIGMIRLMLPNAKIVHCKRNPVDTCFSCYSKNFVNGNLYTYTLEELGQYYGLYHKLMQHWRELDASDIIEVSYEDLVFDQENQTRQLLDACGLEWNDACLNFHKSDRSVITASVTQVREKIYNKSVHRWKHYEPQLAPLIDALRDEIHAFE